MPQQKKHEIKNKIKSVIYNYRRHIIFVFFMLFVFFVIGKSFLLILCAIACVYLIIYVVKRGRTKKLGTLILAIVVINFILGILIMTVGHFFAGSQKKKADNSLHGSFMLTEMDRRDFFNEDKDKIKVEVEVRQNYILRANFKSFGS